MGHFREGVKGTQWVEARWVEAARVEIQGPHGFQLGEGQTLEREGRDVCPGESEVLVGLQAVL